MYITLIVHLVILIILLISQIGFSLQRENSFVIDFSREEELRRMEEKKAFDEKVSKRVEDLIAGASGVEFRNVASSRNQTALKDDRSTDAEQLYKDAERLAKELKNAQTESDDDFAAEPVARKEEKRQKTGPTAGLLSCPGILTAGKRATFRYRPTDAMEAEW